MNPFCLTDFYKVIHPFHYPEGTIRVYSNMTARKSRIQGIDKVVFFGLQYFMKHYLIEYFNDNFFNLPKDEVMEEYKRVMRNTVGELPSYDHISKLYDLGYLPIKIKALPEGARVNIRVPFLTIVNTQDDFYWLTNFLESLMSSIIWQPITSATLAHEYRIMFNKYLKDTIGDTSFAQWMGHDFSFRGMSSLETAMLSGMGHLLSFTGTDTIPAILGLEKYYNADITKELVGASVPATEHSVMCAGTGVEGEFNTIKRLITKIHPSGIISIVSDTFDLWKVLTKYMPDLKEEVMARDGKVVIRPDSGDPCDIICGEKPEHWTRDIQDIPKQKGVIELLWDTFGGTVVNGYKVLDSHIGAIYGDSINLQRAAEISERLIAKGFAPLMIYGIGSYTYQYNTRDTFGMAMKATYIEVKQEDGSTKGIPIFKDPITDDGTKKSAKGLIQVKEILEITGNSLKHKDYLYFDEQDKEDEEVGQLEVVFYNGKLVKDWTLSEIKQTLINQS